MLALESEVQRRERRKRAYEEAGSDDESMQMSDRDGSGQREMMEEFMRQFSERFGQKGHTQKMPQQKAQAKLRIIFKQ